jgi:hypothetical protein
MAAVSADARAWFSLIPLFDTASSFHDWDKNHMPVAGATIKICVGRSIVAMRQDLDADLPVG